MLRFNQIRCLKQCVQINGWFSVRASTQCATDAEKMIQKVLETNSSHPEWKNINKDRKLLPMIANNLSSMGRFEELDQLFDKVGIESCSLGMQTTLLRSYIERQNWESAIDLLKVSLIIWILKFLFTVSFVKQIVFLTGITSITQRLSALCFR